MKFVYSPASPLLPALFALTLAAAPAPPAPAADAPFELRDGDRVLFLGDTFFEREGDYGHIETRLTSRFPDRRVTFRNLAWAADTPMGRARASFDWVKPESEWLKRVKEQVGLVKPTVAFLSYGETASFEGEAGLLKFKADMIRLMDAIREVSGGEVRFVLLAAVVPASLGQTTPAESDRHRLEVIACNKAIETLARERGARFVDPFAAGLRPAGIDADEIHLGESGYLRVADEICRELTGRSPAPGARAEILRAAIRKKNELFFHRWRPANWTYLFGFRKQEQGRNAVEIPRFDPLIEEWEGRIAKLRSLDRQDPAVAKEVARLTAPEPPGPAPTRTGATPVTQPVPTFEVADGFEVALWAEDPQLHKPIEINWDAQGRLWVASSEVYPQIQPGQPATDSVIVLEDRKGAGKADRSTVFAGGLLIPTGVLPDDQGGCYVAASSQLLHFKDTNGDGKADERRIVLSSFGTEDTHHNLHTLRWGYDGRIYMNQSIYTHTHVETPHGIARLNSAGIWRFDPFTFQMEVFTRGGCNPWGHHWDEDGNSFFTDGAGFQGISWCVPGAMYFTYAGARRELQSISPGSYPKFASLEVVRSPQFPDEWQGDFITCDFRAHRVVHFKSSDAPSGYQTTELPDLLRSTNVTFRPIDVKFGPDGALYVADWSNPIIQHGEVDFRDPRRDKERGRIWRVAARGRPALKRPDLARLSTRELFDRTLSKSGWEQEQARTLLRNRGIAARTGKAVGDGAAPLAGEALAWAETKGTERALLQALWLHEAVDVVAPGPLTKLLASENPGMRVAATRILSHWQGQWPDAQPQKPIDLLAKLVGDAHPRVRVEALRALAQIPTARSAELALSVLDKPMDPFLEYALWLTVNDLAEPWLAAIQSGDWKVDGHEKQLEFGLMAIEAPRAAAVLGRLLGDRPLPQNGQGPWIELIGRAGAPAELQRLYDQVLRRGFDVRTAARAVGALNEAARQRQSRPSSGLEQIDLLLNGPVPIQTEAVRLAGAWKSASVPLLISITQSGRSPPSVRQSAFEALREIGGKQVADALVPLCAPEKPLETRRGAVAALTGLDLGRGVPLAVSVLQSVPDEAQALELWRALLSVKGAAAALARALPAGGFPVPAAKAGLRVAREGGRNEPELVLALTRSAGLEDAELALTPAEIQQIAASAAAQGDPARGEQVFRRTELGCVNCHAIGGVGGKVGPDLTSIGASAPMDYLVESVFYPNRKIKEGYQSVVVETADGEELAGVPVREDNEQLVLRDVSNKEVTLPKNRIKDRRTGGSLMPSGLVDTLTPAERIDLFRFLAELGKPGPYDASKGNVARFWKVRPGTHEAEQFGVDKIVTGDLGGEWQPVYSLVDGRLTRDAIQSSLKLNKYTGLVGVFLGARFQVAGSGSAHFKLSDAPGASVWIDGKSVAPSPDLSTPLSGGAHTIVLRLDPTKIPETVRLECGEATFLAN